MTTNTNPFGSITAPRDVTHDPRTPTDERLSPEQRDVKSWVVDGTGNAFVNAVAGSGKTSTLVACTPHMDGDVAFTAFNKKIADEIKSRVDAPNVNVGTFHSFGYRAWKRVAPTFRVDATGKSSAMHDHLKTEYGLRGAVARLVSLAKQSVVDVAWSSNDYRQWLDLVHHFDVLSRVDVEIEHRLGGYDQLAEHVVALARRGVTWASDVGSNLIDFDDMLWLPLLHDAPLPKHDWVLVDEAQDTNVARRMMAERMMTPTSRALWVGDVHQSIYGFSGADADAVNRIVERFDCRQLPLTVTFRCSRAATALARTWVPHIAAHGDNREGRVVRLRYDQIAVGNDDSSYVGGAVPPVGPGDAVLCRLTRPLVTLAFELIRRGIGCYVEGRDIGKQLEHLVTRWKVTSVKALTTNLEAYRERETNRLLLRRDSGAELEALNDRMKTLHVIMDGCVTVSDVVAKINRLFKDGDELNGGRRGLVTLSTVHKAKGREWDRVFILGYGDYMPSKWAKQSWEKQQENNLLYVAATRTKGDLVLTTGCDD